MAQFIFTILINLVFMGCFAQTGKLIVIVKEIQWQKEGELATGIFTEKNFPKVGEQLLGNETAITASEMKIVFDKVPADTYAVVSFQDIDKNKQLKSNFVGYPIEPVGFSGEAKIKFGPPDFNDAKITVEAGKVLTIIITLK